MKKFNFSSVAKKIVAVFMVVALALPIVNNSTVAEASSYSIDFSGITCSTDPKCQTQTNQYTYSGKSLKFNKVGSYATFSNPLSDTEFDGFAFGGWVWYTGWYELNAVTEIPAISVGDASGSYLTLTSFGSVIYDGTTVKSDGTGLGHKAVSGNGESWAHVLLSCDNDSLDVYVNGALISSTTITDAQSASLIALVKSNANAVLGGAYGDYSTWANFVQLANVTFYDSALTASEVKAINSVDLSTDTDLSASPLTMVFGDGATFNATNYTYDAATEAITWNGRAIELAIEATPEPTVEPTPEVTATPEPTAVPDDGKLEVSDYIVDGERTAPVEDGKVFAGWFADEECTTKYTEESGRAYAKFVDADVLTIKYQLGTNTNSGKVRFVTSVDSLVYDSIGFKIEDSAKNSSVASEFVYTSLMGAGSTYEPTVFSESSAYFATFTLNAADWESTIKVTPYWITEDGTTVYGAAREITIQ